MMITMMIIVIINNSSIFVVMIFIHSWSAAFIYQECEIANSIRFLTKTKIQPRLYIMYSSSVSAAWGKTFTAAHSERAVHWEEDIKDQTATVEECVTKDHGYLHHLVDGTSEVHS